MLVPSCSSIFCYFLQVYTVLYTWCCVLTCAFPYLVRTCHWYPAVDGWPDVVLSRLVGWREQDDVPVYHFSVNLKQDMRDIPTFKQLNACNFFILTVDPRLWLQSVTNDPWLKIWKCYEWVTVLNGVIIRVKFHDWSNSSAILTEVTDIQHITVLHS